MHSLSEVVDLTCGECGRALAFELWLIVDAGEHPDLLARARAGELHTVACPTCGPLGEIDAPLLIYLPDHDAATGQPPLVFSPARQTSQEQDQQMAAGLLRKLAGRLGAAWRSEWLAQVVSVRRDLLPVALSDDPLTALREHLMQDSEDAEDDEELPPALVAALMEIAEALAQEGVLLESPQDLERALAAHPDLAERFKEAMRAAMMDDEGMDDEGDVSDNDSDSAATLPDLLNRFVRLGTWDDAQRMVEAHPALLSDEADSLFSAAIARAQASRDAGAVEHFTVIRDVLRRCREAGIARAFAEQMLPPEGLAEAERLGMTPEEFLEEMRAAEQRMPAALGEVLAALAEEGVLIHSLEDLQQALAARPDLAARLEEAMQAGDAGSIAPMA
uniref:CpXC domain-containing protein n=1 Tax=Caldilinea aerophila TaxID=133453 RepID=A0A7C1FP75_9CHLR